ncbi:MAG TPA: glycosyltransferase family 2 protein [Anaerolineaceae bacterium]
MKIYALIPAYNESAAITSVVQASQKHLEVLVVDDGSKDDTAALAEAAGALVVRQVPNQGKGAALRAGFRRAIEDGCDAVVMLDADGQHDPAEIPAFLACWQQNHSDLIIGQRTFAKMPWLRRNTNTIGTWMFSWAMGQHIPDNQSGYRLLSRRLMQATLESSESGFEFEVEMIVTCLKSGFRLDWVPIRTIYQGEHSHIQPLKHLVNFIRVVLAARRAMHAKP